MAELFLAYRHEYLPESGHKGVKDILETSAGQSMSQEQQQFVKTGNAICRIGNFGQTLQNHYHCRLYGVSEDDAKKMAKAFIEVLTSRAQFDVLKSKKEELIAKIEEAKKILREKKAERETAETKYKKMKKQRHYYLNDNIAIEQSQKTLLEISKIRDNLEIELAGMKAKMNAIQDQMARQYARQDLESKKEPTVRVDRSSMVERLEQMKTDLIIELATVEAKQLMAGRLLSREVQFQNLYENWITIFTDETALINDLNQYESSLSKVKNKLAKPEPDMLPPVVYQNKVTIHLVRLND